MEAQTIPAGTVTAQIIGTSTNAGPVLPYDKRYYPLHYQNADGTLGVTAYPINYEDLYNLKGRLLTLIDATFSDPRQRKAQKDVFWQALQAWMHDIERGAGAEPGPPTLHTEGNEDAG